MDPQNSSGKNVTRLLGLVLVIALVLVGYFVYRSAAFHVVGTNPSTRKVPTVATYFDINFNKALDSKGVSLSSTPNIISSYKVTGKVIKISLDTATMGTLKTGQLYEIVVHQISDTGGQELKNLTFSFKPVSVPASDLSKNQQQALLKQQTQYNTAASDPLIQKLPFDGPGLEYEISYTVQYDPKPQYTVTITSPTLQGQEDAIAWIKSLGVNPSNYIIEYSTQAVQ